ncbi:MAG: O-antigen ligase family protein [bacterium]|nr:O-antigen ligase family protein [bacterium]
MKYLVFFTVLIVGVPVGFAFAKNNKKIENIILFLTLFFTCRVESETINFISRENYRGTSRGFEITVVDILILILFLLVIHRKKLYKIKILPPCSILFFLYFLFSLISITNSGSSLYSYFEIWKMIRMYLFYWIFYNYIHDVRQINSIIKYICIIIIYVFLLVLEQKYLLGMFQVKGPFPHQNSMAMYMIVFGSIVFSMLLNTRKGAFNTYYLLAVFGMSGICVISSLSRAGIACFALSLFIIFVLSYFSGFNFKKIGLTVLFIVLGGIVLYKAIDTIMLRFETAPEESAQTRVVLANSATMMANDKIFGIGLNNFGLKINPPYPYGADIPRTKWNEKEGLVETIYLMIAAETGWINLGIFLIMLIKFYCMNIANYFRYRKIEYVFVAIGLIGGLTGIYIESALEWVLKQTNNFYQLMLIFAIIGVMSKFYKVYKKKK